MSHLANYNPAIKAMLAPHIVTEQLMLEPANILSEAFARVAKIKIESDYFSATNQPSI